MLSTSSYPSFFSPAAPCDLSDEDMSIVDSQEDGHSLMSLGGGGSKHLSGKLLPLGGGGPSSLGGGGRHDRGGDGKKGGDRKSARARTVLSEKQLNILKTCYSANPRPDALMKEQLVEMTGLSPRVVRVWFQNKRCKDKKIQNRMMEKQMQREAVSGNVMFSGYLKSTNSVDFSNQISVRHRSANVAQRV